jgi:hypothetical protein
MPPRTRRRTRQKGAKAKKSSPKTPLPVLSADRVTVVKRAQVKDAPKGVLSLDEARECAGLRVGGLDVANHFLGGLYERMGEDNETNGAPSFEKIVAVDGLSSSVMRIFRGPPNGSSSEMARWCVGSSTEMAAASDGGWVRSGETHSLLPLEQQWQLGGEGCGFFADDDFNATAFRARLSKKIDVVAATEKELASFKLVLLGPAAAKAARKARAETRGGAKAAKASQR